MGQKEKEDFLKHKELYLKKNFVCVVISAPIKKMEGVARTDMQKIVTKQDYLDIIGFINSFKGLAVDCEIAVLNNKHFSMYTVDTLKNIVGLQSTHNIRINSRESDFKVKKFIDCFKETLLNGTDTQLMLNYAVAENINPVKLARKFLLSMFDKKHVSKILKCPFQLYNENLYANVEQCLYNDILDGPCADMRRRCLGEEYEYKLREHCDSLKLSYQDEHQLRKLGFDKTPDIRLTVPFLYRGKIINWIESKATFGDNNTHMGYVQVQLNSYCNRFGPGIVIYWFGYTENTPHMDINDVGIMVLDDFPPHSELELMTSAT